MVDVGTVVGFFVLHHIDGAENFSLGRQRARSRRDRAVVLSGLIESFESPDGSPR